MSEINAQFIMETIRSWVEEKKQMTAEQWITAAEKLNLLESYEHDRLIQLEGEVSTLINLAMESQDKKNVSAARLKIKADPKYQEFRKQEMFVKRIDEAIRLAKSHARLVSYNL